MAIGRVPNILTGFRIVFAIGLLFVVPLSAGFFLLYLLCGATDALDGFIARKTGSVSSFGAAFDSVADLIFFGVLLAVLLPVIQCPSWVIYWILFIAAARLTALGVGYVKYHKVSLLHTYANKATGAALFLFPFLYVPFGIGFAAAAVCALATLSSGEELAITLTSRELNRDIRWIFTKKR